MGINAQETPPDPISGPELTEPEQPDMAYQPPADADTRYSYDTMGNLTAVLTTNTSNSQPLQEGSLRYTQIAYDNFGRKIGMTDPDMGTWTYKYNAAGSLTEQRDANLARLCFTYDSLDRLQYKRHDNDNDGCESSDTQLAFYDYYAVDAGGGYVGRLKEIQWSASTSTDRETFAYDTLGRLTSHTRLIYNRSYTMSYSSFDALHRPTTITYPNGQTSVTTFDREGPNTLANSGTNLISNIRFNGMGQMTTLQRSSGGIHTTYEYHPQTDVANGGLGDSNFRLKTIQHGAAGTGNAWPDFTYEYDDVGNITKMTTVSTAGTDIQSFGYDHLNRLISASASGVSPTYSHTYGYNKIGNLTNNGGVSQTYGSSSHVHALTSAAGVTYSYDNNGNMTFRNASGTVNDYTHTFNVENELVSVVNNGNTTTFAYDAAGIRVKTVAPNGTVTDYPFPGYEVESPTSNPTVRLTFSIAGQAVALKVMGSSTNTYYLYNDHLGSTATMSTNTGGPVTGSTARYYPFGDWRTEPTAGLTDRGFTGHLHNNIGTGADDIGLVYMQARWYLPGLGRFASADSIIPNPANPQSYNRYSYVENRPLTFRDPTGHISCTDSHLPGDDQQACQATPAPPSIQEQVTQGSNIYGIIFTSDDGKAWTNEQMEAVLSAARDIEYRFRLQGDFIGYRSGQIWREIFGVVTMRRSSKTHYMGSDGQLHKITYGAETFGSTIEVYDSASSDSFRFRLNMVHEFGHRFNAVTVNAINMNPYNELDVAISSGVLPLRGNIRDGMPGKPYQQSSIDNTTNNELFADMFVNWTYQSFLNNPEGSLERSWMNNQMPVWLRR